ncbi:MAG: pyridoxal-dependent decarboxylase, partial [Vicinamibacterales bacterium]|nr:pyridoxal-dependent decarboxylase [Vicinamibacterales bacterium]
MTPRLPNLLAELELDAGADAAGAFMALVTGYFAETRLGEGPVSTARTPDELAARFREPLPLEGRPLADVLGRLRTDVLPDGNRLAHPRSLGHQVSAPLAIAVWTEALTAALNQSAAVWEMSPVGTAIETQVVRWMCELAGFGASAGGTFTSGGTEATFAALLAARQAARPDAWRRGVGADPPVVVCGEHAHYGVARAIGELGLGTDHAVTVPSREFRMDVDA